MIFISLQRNKNLFELTPANRHHAALTHCVEKSTRHQHAHAWKATMDNLLIADQNVPATRNVLCIYLVLTRSVKIPVREFVESTQNAE